MVDLSVNVATAAPVRFGVTDRTGYIAGLDGLRAISILLVIVGHYGFQTVVPGALGLTLFFFISGFLITTLLLAEHERLGTIRIRDFYVRRFLRLAPELYGLVAVSGVVGISYLGVPKIIDVLCAMFYTSNYLYIALSSEDGLSVMMRWPQLWSLAIEEHFYLTFPAIVIACSARKRQLIVCLLCVCAFCLVWRTIAHGLGFGHAYTYAASECRIDSIGWGCLTAILLHGARPQLRHGELLANGAACAGIVLLLLSLAIRDVSFRETTRYTVQGIGLALAFPFLFMTQAGGLAQTLLEIPAVRWIGRRSYGMYLWHLEVLLLFKFLTGNDIRTYPIVTKILLALVGIGLSCLLSEASNVVFLKPAARLRSRFGSHLIT